MAKLDQFIDALFKHRAQRLVLTADAKAELAFADQTKPVTATPLSGDVVTSLLAEIAPREVRNALGADGEHEFRYEAPSGPVTVRARRDGDTMSFEASPEGQDIDANGSGGGADPSLAEPAAPPPPMPESVTVSIGSTGATSGMDALFNELVREGCSDLHLCAGNPPLFRKDGSIATLSGEKTLRSDQVEALLFSITPDEYREQFVTCHDVDFSYEIEGLAQFRCNLFRDRLGMGGVFRVIPSETPSAEDIGLSSHVLKLCELSKGLVVVTGPTGSGKSTTLAAMIDYVNRNRSDHIITIEDPIEFVHGNKKCLINQREIGNHTLGFKPALRAALREDPDIVLVGEMRDLETVEIAIETAETGHLVFGTLHTNTAPSTVDRIIDQFSADRQSQIRAMLSSSLKGVVAQTLCKKKGGGRVAALEILIVNHAVSNLIREEKTFQIPSIMQSGAKLGMVSLNDSLLRLVTAGVVEPEEAMRKSVDRLGFEKLLERKGIDIPVSTPA